MAPDHPLAQPARPYGAIFIRRQQEPIRDLLVCSLLMIPDPSGSNVESPIVVPSEVGFFFLLTNLAP